MVSVLSSNVTTRPAEQRVLLCNVSWQSYEQILMALGERRSARLIYFDGYLEIMTPLEEHEGSSSRIDQFINVVTEERNQGLKSLQSTRLSKPELLAGAEPDQCYYIANEQRVRGKTVNLAVDPPPDLVVEVDITHTDIDKNALYVAMGVPEFWRYDGQVLRIYLLQDGAYQESETSLTFPEIAKDLLYQFLSDCNEQGETVSKRQLRDRLKQ
ncbi:MAG: Uma2 family endonuclease [Leptolyngbyaceae bacterium]|nr:Uma2 family endonuclease [Leptolyngbyaceae bacterium]